MKRIAIMSDLHVDSNNFGELETNTLKQVLKDNQIDHLHLAGDVSNDYLNKTVPYLDKIADAVPKLTMTLGNHDMLGMDEDSINNLDFQIFDGYEDFTLVTLSGWYDYSFCTEKTHEENLKTKNTFWFDAKLHRPQTDEEITADIIAKLDDVLAHAPKEKAIVVAMHFVPNEKFTIAYPRFDKFNAFLGSQRFHDLFVKYDVRDVVFGHYHVRMDPTTIQGVQYHARPLGYKREWDMQEAFFEAFPQYLKLADPNPSKRLNHIKALPEYDQWYRDHLYEEFSDSLTVFVSK
jgi:putative phosphoesterase